MNTRTKVISSLAMVVAIVAGTVAYWSSQRDTPDDPSQARAHEVPVEQAVKKSNALKQTLVQVEQAENEGDNVRVAMGVQAFAAELGGRAGKVLAMGADRNISVKMYGKVIDQNGQPVSGAKVRAIVAGGGTYAPGSGLRLVTTDAKGMFVLTGRGQEIAILDVEHPKLTNVEFLSETGSGQKRRSTGLKAVSPYGEQFSWRTYDSPDNPYVIRVWRVDKFEKLVTRSGYFHPLPDGVTPAEFALPYGLLVTCLREPKESGVHWRHQKGSWSITFRPIDGGIQQTDDIYLNRAPESGYQLESTIAMQRGDPNYKPFDRRPYRYYYYFMEDGRKLYGNLEVFLKPYMSEDSCEIKVKALKYNPKGSRGLAAPRRPY